VPIPVRCPACRAEYTVIDDYRAKTVRCKHCGSPFAVAAAATAPLPPLPDRPVSPSEVIAGQAIPNRLIVLLASACAVLLVLLGASGAGSGGCSRPDRP
jgi:predicted Zn finger-like uncharacterized protein